MPLEKLVVIVLIGLSIAGIAFLGWLSRQKG